jgi:hypothetical protein
MYLLCKNIFSQHTYYKKKYYFSEVGVQESVISRRIFYSIVFLQKNIVEDLMKTKIKFGLTFLATLVLTLITGLILSPLSYFFYVITFATGINFVPVLLFFIAFSFSMLLSKKFLNVMDNNKRLIRSGITAILVTFCVFQVPTLMEANNSLKAGLPLSLDGKQEEMRNYLQNKYPNINFDDGFVYKHHKETAYSSTFFLSNDPSLGIVVTIEEDGSYHDSYQPDFFASRQRMISIMEETFPGNPLNSYITFAVTPVRVNASGVFDGSFGADVIKENSSWTEKEALSSFLEVAKVYRSIPIEEYDSNIFPEDMVMFIYFYESNNSIDVNKLVNRKYGKQSGLASEHERKFYQGELEDADAVLKYEIRVPYEKLNELNTVDDVSDYLTEY